VVPGHGLNSRGLETGYIKQTLNNSGINSKTNLHNMTQSMVTEYIKLLPTLE